MKGAVDKQRLRSLLCGDPIWAIYALADLQPEFDAMCRWYVSDTGDATADDTDDDTAVALLFTGLTLPTFFAAGSPHKVRSALQQAPLQPQVYISIREEHLPIFAELYDFSADTRPMQRLALPVKQMVEMPAHPGLVRLQGDDAPRVRTLLAHGGPFTPDAFEPYQLENGIFYAVADATGALLAVGGTHVVDRESSQGAIGNMYTKPEARGRGHAGAVLRAIIATLQAQGIDQCVLNVDQRNRTAQHIYEAFGFVAHCSYVEGIGKARHALCKESAQ